MTTVYVILGIITYLFLGGVYLGYEVAEFFASAPTMTDIVLNVLLWPLIIVFRLMIHIVQLPYKLGGWIYKKIH